MTSCPSISASGALRLLLVAMLVAVGALLVPSVALGEPAAVEDEVVTTAPAAPADVGEAPVAEAPPADPAPVDEQPVVEAPVEAPVVEAPVVEAPVVEAPVVETAPPPATGEVPLPPETESTPTPAPAPAVVETAPPPTASTLPTTPDAPRPAAEPDKLPAALLPVVRIPPVAPHPVTTAVVADVNASVPDAPAAPTRTVVADATPAPATAIAPPPSRTALRDELFTLDPDQGRSPVAPVDATAIERGPGTAFGEEGGSTLFSESVSVPFGSVTSGSSLLAVLAGYVLPGVGGPPASTIVMFILVGLIVAIARAPRPQLSERAHDGALLGAARGHGLVVCRPG